MEEKDYWKLKAQILQLRLEESQIENMLNDVVNRRNQFFAKHGLGNNLRFNDDQFSIEEIK